MNWIRLTWWKLFSIALMAAFVGIAFPACDTEDGDADDDDVADDDDDVADDDDDVADDDDDVADDDDDVADDDDDDTKTCGFDLSAVVECQKQFCEANPEDENCQPEEGEEETEEPDCEDEDFLKSLECVSAHFVCDEETGAMTQESALEIADCMEASGDDDDVADDDDDVADDDDDVADDDDDVADDDDDVADDDDEEI